MPRKTKRKAKPRDAVTIEPCAFSIPAFCIWHNLSIDTFFRMNREGWGPKVMKVGARTLISREAAARWREEREAASS